MKFFLFLITLQLSLISTFCTSNIALAVNHENNNNESNQTTINLNQQQLQILINSISNINQKPIQVDIVSDEQKWYEKPLIVAVAGTVLGAVLGALLPWIISKKTDQTKTREQLKINTFELAKDWDSQDMRESRTLAWKKFSKQRACCKNFHDYYESQDFQDNNYAINMLRIVDFFDRIYFLEKNELIDRRLAQTIFSEPFKNWNEECFKFQNEALTAIQYIKPDIEKTFAFVTTEGKPKLDWLINTREN
jgi:hypothetical protein